MTVVAAALALTACGTATETQSGSANTADPAAPTAPVEAAPTEGGNAPTVSVEANPTEAGSTSVSVEQALSAATGYFDAFDSGDTNAVLSWFRADAAFSDNFTGAISRAAWEQRLAWNLAQGTTLDEPDCVAEEPDATGARTVTCASGTRNAQIRAVGAHPVLTVVTLTVGPDGIEAFDEEFGQPDFLVATQPFMEWMNATHSRDAGMVGFGVWDSIEEAVANGELTADYARRWAEHLAEACIHIPGLIDPASDSYLDDCGFVDR